MDDIEIIEADLSLDTHAQAIVSELDAYARDPVAKGQGLPDDVKRALVPGLKDNGNAIVFLAFQGKRPIGIAVCFVGFSTFAGKRLLNVHDLAVEPDVRGRGVGRRILAAVERKALALGCCKITLEVQENNARARGLYASSGFEAYELDPAAGRALFWQKKL